MATPEMDFYVLDTVANDIESLDDVVRLVNHPEIGSAAEAGHSITSAEVLLALRRLVRDQLVLIYVPSAESNELEALPLGRLPSVPREDADFAGQVRARRADDRLRHARLQVG